MNKEKNIKRILISIAVIIVLICCIIVYCISGTKFKEVVINNNQSASYSDRLLKEIYEDDQNTLISDLTLNTALALFYSEGSDTVKKELNDYFGDFDVVILEEYNNMYERYKHAYKKVNYASSLWLDKRPNFELSATAKATATKKLHFDIKEVKLVNSIDTINKWVSKKTRGKIPEALKRGDIDNQTRSVLISTLYFDEKWNEKYQSEDIMDGVFTGSQKKSNVTFMSSEENYYLEDVTATGFMKPYKDEGLYFIGAIPKEDYKIEDISIESLLKTKEEKKVDVTIPEFEYRYDVELKDVLNNIGVTGIFEAGNLDNMANELYISRIVQKNYINVSRKGTKAASVNISVGKEWLAISNLEVILDRPFVFAIYDETIDQVLFIGNVNNL